MSKITKATEAERAEYARTGPVYPLYGWTKLDGQPLAIEDLHGSWSAPDPVYEVMAPKGYHFQYEGTHTLLCHSHKDIASRLRGLHLVPCTIECGNM